MEGNAVKVHIKGHAVLEVQGLQGVEPAAHELRIRGRGDAAAVLGEEAALRDHVESGEERQPLIEHRTHDVAVPGTAEELQGEERAHRLGRGDLLRAGEARLLEHAARAGSSSGTARTRTGRRTGCESAGPIDPTRAHRPPPPLPVAVSSAVPHRRAGVTWRNRHP